jgi:hypothetical protein
MVLPVRQPFQETQMLAGTLTAALFWLVSASGTLPVATTAQATTALENTYYAQLDGIT